MGPNPFFGYKIHKIKKSWWFSWLKKTCGEWLMEHANFPWNLWIWETIGASSRGFIEVGRDWFRNPLKSVFLFIHCKIWSTLLNNKAWRHQKHHATVRTNIDGGCSMLSTNMDLEFDAFPMDLLRCTSGIPLVCGNGQKNHWNDVSLPNSVEQSWLHYDEICIISPPKSRNLRILQCLVSEDSWRRPICSWRAATGEFTSCPWGTWQFHWQHRRIRHMTLDQIGFMGH